MHELRLFGLLLIAVPGCAQLEWVRQFGTPTYDLVQSVALDESGVYAAGSTSGALPGETNGGGRDAFLRKYDRQGNVLWTVQWSSPVDDTSAAVSAADNAVYLLTGEYSTGTQIVARLVKFDRNGTQIWTRSLASTPNFSVFAQVYPHAVAAAAGFVYVAGGVRGDLPGQSSSSTDEAFIVKFDSSGNVLWTRQFGISAEGNALVLDNASVYLAGTAEPNFGMREAFLRKYDHDGNSIWTRQFGTQLPLGGAAIDSTGIYISTYPALRKFDVSGNTLWSRTDGLPGSLAASADGFYLSGSINGALPGQISYGDWDAFVQRYDRNGGLLWSRQLGSPGGDGSSSIAVDGSGIYMGGLLRAAFPGQVALGQEDAFLARLDPRGPQPPPPLRFVPVTPCRVVDTRAGQGTSGVFGPPSMNGGTVRTFPLPEGRCGLPTNALAWSLNVTVVPIEALSYLTLWPAGAFQPYVSTLNSFHGGVVANAAIVPAGEAGGVSVYVTNRTDVIVDVNGYFVDPAVPQSLSFYPLPPCRAADTRLAAAPLQAGVARPFALAGSACGLPLSAGAYALNATVVPRTILSYLTLWPTGSAQPLVSTLNSFEGAIVANAAIVPAGTAGSVNAFATDTTDLVLDASGYFAPPGGLGELRFYPVTPCRITDTRTAGFFGAPAPLHANESRDFSLAGTCGVPAAAKAFALNVTVVPNGPLGFLTIWPAATSRPVVSTLNSPLGRILANAAIVPAGLNGAASIYVTNETNVILDINGYFQ